MSKWLEELSFIRTDEQKLSFKKNIENIGFSALNRLILSFYDKLKFMEEKEFKEVKRWVELGKELFPNLFLISPSWENTWEELMGIYTIKVALFEEVPQNQRDGEWQVIFDNPLSNDEIVCNPNLSFVVATYLMAKYQLHLKKAEYVKLQKVALSITKKGN